MRKSLLVLLAGIALFSACNSAKKPGAANFTAAINQYLANHGQVCISIGGQFPIDVPVSQQGSQQGIVTKLAALEHAGLVNETDTTAVVQSLANSLSLSPHKLEPVKRYTVSAEGQKYLQTVMTDFGKAPGFCYGQKQVDAITKWTEPATAGSSTQTEVNYTYKIVNRASWATRSDVQRAFPAITAMLEGASRTTQMAGLQLSNKGWQVAK